MEWEVPKIESQTTNKDENGHFQGVGSKRKHSEFLFHKHNFNRIVYQYSNKRCNCRSIDAVNGNKNHIQNDGQNG